MRLFLIIAILFCESSVFGQSTPLYDKSWVLNAPKSDEFNSSFNFSLWDKKGGVNEYFKPENVFTNDSNLVIKIHKGENQINSGFINSKNASYLYGYYEMRAKLPGFYNHGKSCGRGFWPQFWLFYGATGVHDEIDILEPSGCQYDNAMTNVYGWFDEDGNGGAKKVSGDLIYTNDKPLFEEYHKYAVEWMPERIVYYFDDKAIFEWYNEKSIPNHNLTVIITVGLDNNCAPIIETPWPCHMYVDYFRYYELNKNSCNETVYIGNNNELNTPLLGVKNDVTIGNGSADISMNSGNAITIRAINDITINGEFTVPLGSELNLLPTLGN